MRKHTSHREEKEKYLLIEDKTNERISVRRRRTGKKKYPLIEANNNGTTSFGWLTTKRKKNIDSASDHIVHVRFFSFCLLSRFQFVSLHGNNTIYNNISSRLSLLLEFFLWGGCCRSRSREYIRLFHGGASLAPSKPRFVLID